MDSLAGDFTIRHPLLDDAPAALGLMIACDIAEYGEPDSSLEDLLDQWSEIDLGQDAWLVVTSHNKPVGYAGVFKSGHRFTFDLYVHPTLAPAGLTKQLLAQCQARAYEQLKVEADPQAIASIIVSQGNLAGRQIAEELGFKPHTYHLGMQISLDAPPPSPVWPAGITLRLAIPDRDDRPIYELIQAAFDRPGRVPPSFERWRDGMMGASNFDSDLWFLTYHGEELIGAALCFDYPQYGWVRQLGVAERWRRQGIGSALLQHAFGVFYERGHATIGLGVESNNLNAYRLYESVGMTCKRQYAEYRKALFPIEPHRPAAPSPWP